MTLSVPAELRTEFYGGGIIVAPPPDAEHAAIVTRLTCWLVQGGFAADRVLAHVGVLVSHDSGTGRCPDLVVLRDTAAPSVVWHDADFIRLVVEVVSRSTEDVDRLIKPGEYACAGIAHFWRVERAAQAAPTVHWYRLGTDEKGQRAYVSHRAVLLSELLAGSVPNFD